MIFVLIFALFAGMAKAGRDTIAHHWHDSVFFQIRSEFWFKWFRSAWTDKPNHPVWFLWDGWHFFDTLEKLCYFSIVLLMSTKCLPSIFPLWAIWVIVAGCAAMAGVGFYLFYWKVFYRK